MTLTVYSPRVYTVQGVPISVHGIAQVKISGSNDEMLRYIDMIYQITLRQITFWYSVMLHDIHIIKGLLPNNLVISNLKKLYTSLRKPLKVIKEKLWLI